MYLYEASWRAFLLDYKQVVPCTGSTGVLHTRKTWTGAAVGTSSVGTGSVLSLCAGTVYHTTVGTGVYHPSHTGVFDRTISTTSAVTGSSCGPAVCHTPLGTLCLPVIIII